MLADESAMDMEYRSGHTATLTSRQTSAIIAPMISLTKPFLLPTTLVTFSCLAALIYGCGGCIDSETVSGSETSQLETQNPRFEILDDLDLADETLDVQDSETGDNLDKLPQSDPLASEDSCTVIIDACCWCSVTDDPICVVGLGLSGCLDVGGSMVAGCVLVSHPPFDLDGPLCQFQCV